MEEEDLRESTKIQWNRSEDGFVTSKCGRWSVSPVYLGRVNAIGYELSDATVDPESTARFSRVVYGGAGYTQRDCKERAQVLANKPQL